MLIAHFSNQTGSSNLIDDVNNNKVRLPLFLTTDFELGSNYGSHLALFKVSDDIENFARISRVGSNGNGTTNKLTNGMIEYIIETNEQLNNFLDSLEGCGARHMIHVQHIVEKQRELRLANENKVAKPKRRRRLRA